MINSNKEKKAIIINANNSRGLILFRLSLIIDLIKQGYWVIVTLPNTTTPSDIEIIQKTGAVYYTIIMQPNKKNPLYEIYTLFQYWRCFKKYSPDLVINYTIKPNIYGGLVARLLKLKYIGVVTGLGSAFLGKKTTRILICMFYRLTLKKAQKILFLNKRDCLYFRKNKLILPAQIDYLPGEGLNLNYYTFSPLPPINKFKFIYIGRLIKDKGIVEYYEAAKLIKSAYPNTEFQILGPLDEFNSLSIGKAQLNSWIASGIIDYLGETNDVRPFIEAIHCVVLPSYAEGLSRILLEACSLGRLVIASNVPGCREIIDNGINGYLCKKKDIFSLKNAIEKILFATEEKLEKMAISGRIKVQNQFSEKLVLLKYNNLISSLLN